MHVQHPIQCLLSNQGMGRSKSIKTETEYMYQVPFTPKRVAKPHEVRSKGEKIRGEAMIMMNLTKQKLQTRAACARRTEICSQCGRLFQPTTIPDMQLINEMFMPNARRSRLLECINGIVDSVT